MSHELYYDSYVGCVVLNVKNTVTIDRIKTIAPKVAHMCSKTGCRRLLNDMSEATIKVSLLELFESPQIMSESDVTQSIKRALVIPPTFDEPEFLENVTRNRGHNFKVFEDVKQARKWLLSEE